MLLVASYNTRSPHLQVYSFSFQTLRAIVQKCLHKGDELGAKSIAFPLIGTGNLNFPRDAASRIMLEETISFCQTNPGSKVQDIRFVAFEQDQALTAAFKQEMDKLKRQTHRASQEHAVRIFVLGKKNAGVEKAVESLKKGFSEACTTQKIEDGVISQLSHKQIYRLRGKAEDRDVKLVVEADVDRIVVRGQPTEVSEMVGEIWKEISERTKKKQEEEQVLLVSTNIEWTYKLHGSKMAFDPRAKAKIEIACSKDEPRVKVSLHGEQFIVDLKAKTGRGQRSGELITLKRKVKRAEEG